MFHPLPRHETSRTRQPDGAIACPGRSHAEQAIGIMAGHRRSRMSGKTYRNITIVEETEAEDFRQRFSATLGFTPQALHPRHPTARGRWQS